MSWKQTAQYSFTDALLVEHKSLSELDDVHDIINWKERETIITWQELTGATEPFYPDSKGAGRRPTGVERMLRIHFLRHWFNLSDPAAEEALYDSRALRRFVGIDLGREPAADETTLSSANSAI